MEYFNHQDLDASYATLQPDSSGWRPGLQPTRGGKCASPRHYNGSVFSCRHQIGSIWSGVHGNP